AAGRSADRPARAVVGELLDVLEILHEPRQVGFVAPEAIDLLRRPVDLDAFPGRDSSRPAPLARKSRLLCRWGQRGVARAVSRRAPGQQGCAAERSDGAEEMPLT